VGLRCFVFDGAVSPAVCDQPFVPSLVVLFGCPLWIGQRCYDGRDVFSDLHSLAECQRALADAVGTTARAELAKSRKRNMAKRSGTRMARNRRLTPE
jgi:hypothetical protein